MKTCSIGLTTSSISGKPVRAGTRQNGSRIMRSALLPKAIAESHAVPFTNNSEHLQKWSRDSWRNYVALQQPEYPDKVLLCWLMRPLSIAVC